jgi:hypothetical protein
MDKTRMQCALGSITLTLLFEGWREEREKWESTVFGLLFSGADWYKNPGKNFYVF